MHTMEIMSENIQGDEMASKGKVALRALGFMILALIIASIAVIFNSPSILMGITGILFPIGLFIMLLIAFYLLILSTKG